MLYLKKLLFGFFFLIFFTAFHFLILPLFSSYEWIFGFTNQSGIQLLSLSLLLIGAAFSFVIFAALSQDWPLGVVIAVLGALTPLVFAQNSSSLVLAGFYLVGLLATYFSVESRMKKYYTFDPSMVLVPSIKTLCTLIALIISIGFYFSMNLVISQKGFTIPESVIPDSLINSIIHQQAGQLVQGDKYLAQITPEMIEYAKQHPELLQQYGVTPDQLDQLQTQPASSAPAGASSSSAKPKSVQVPTTTLVTPASSLLPSTATVKKLALEPINNLLKDYQFFIAPFLGLILFSSFSFFFFLFFLFNLISGAIMHLIFYILEKTNFIRFEKEMREVKKLIV